MSEVARVAGDGQGVDPQLFCAVTISYFSRVAFFVSLGDVFVLIFHSLSPDAFPGVLIE